MTFSYCEFSDPAVEGLDKRLAFALAQDEVGTYRIKHIVELLSKRTKVEIFSDEHPPPHFHVNHDGQGESYSLCDCSVVDDGGFSGKMRREVRSFYTENRQKLIDRWNETRPSGCPVGRFREEWCT